MDGFVVGENAITVAGGNFILGKKIRFYKNLLAEICETLCTICLCMATDREHGRYREHFNSHFIELKKYSEILRGIEKQ